MPAKEFKGKTVDEAIFRGLNELGVSIDEVKINIVNYGGKGFLGIGKSAVVMMTPKSELPEEELREEEALRERAEEEERREREERRASQPPRERNRERDRRPKDGRQQNRGSGGAKPQTKPQPQPAPSYEFTEPCAAQVFLEGVLQRMNVQATCKTVKQDEEKLDKIIIQGKDTALLIGRRGETLDALQYLTGLAVNHSSENEGYRKITIDTENYRAKREDTLHRLARRMANKVVRSGKDVTLEPMNPYERRVLHYALQNHPKVETVSEGEDPKRCVVVRLKRSGSQKDS